ncbi:YcgJ family protein [Hafnia alvei]|uniref:YcgJ family protein n=1 Tax=Hafnia alvei TaxID=569 RepID=UPI0009B8853E|nr:YcgJ family protein [Hafnia alvei]
MTNKLLVVMALSLGALSANAVANTTKVNPRSPTAGVVCDVYFCANDKGVSAELTTRYLGKKKGARLTAQGDFDHSAFTFSNGVFCDSTERLCRKDRYFGVDGKRGGKIDEHYTELLYGHKP